MIAQLRLTILVDNSAARPNLRAEHGLSVWIETGNSRILFDTGQGGALCRNAEQLGVPLDRTDIVVLSHGHYDHTGGVSHVLARSGRSRVYVHPLGFESKYANREGGPARRICIPDAVASDLLERNYSLVANSAPAQIASGAFLTGEIPRAAEPGDARTNLFLDEKCTEPDPVRDEQALFFETGRGIVVLLGCGHAGILNTLDYVTSLSGSRSIHAVLGGMHLDQAADSAIDRVAMALARYGVRVVGPCHCTGTRAIARLRQGLGPCVVDCGAGSSFVFPAADSARASPGSAGLPV